MFCFSPIFSILIVDFFFTTTYHYFFCTFFLIINLTKHIIKAIDVKGEVDYYNT